MLLQRSLTVRLQLNAKSLAEADGVRERSAMTLTNEISRALWHAQLVPLHKTKLRVGLGKHVFLKNSMSISFPSDVRTIPKRDGRSQLTTLANVSSLHSSNVNVTLAFALTHWLISGLASDRYMLWKHRTTNQIRKSIRMENSDCKPQTVCKGYIPKWALTSKTIIHLHANVKLAWSRRATSVYYRQPAKCKRRALRVVEHTVRPHLWSFTCHIWGHVTDIIVYFLFCINKMSTHVWLLIRHACCVKVQGRCKHSLSPLTISTLGNVVLMQ